MYERFSSPDTPEQDAKIIRKGLRNALIAISAGVLAYVIAALVTFMK